MQSIPFSPIFASALDFAFKKATTEGKITIGVLLILSIFSWTVIITKARQLYRARKTARKFFKAYREHARSAGNRPARRGVRRRAGL